MILYTEPALSDIQPCPYLPGHDMVYEYFFASELSPQELTWLLSQGWRTFGVYYFRPSCPHCQACTPLRVPVHDFTLSRSQARVWRKGADIVLTMGALRYDNALFDLYQRHSMARFAQCAQVDDFLLQLHTPSCPSLLSRYELGAHLVGAGYLDQAADGLSSVYFIFDPDYARLSPGILSALHEIAETRRLGLDYYYLGYVVPGCARMDYKARFYPHELYSWSDKAWHTVLTP